jgi:glycosyltransferase involved in cell wall biosynthesis
MSGAATDPAATRRALAQRLRAAAAVLSDRPMPERHPDPARDAAVVLDLLVRQVHADLSPDRIWLLCAAVSSCLPTADDLLATLRQFELSAVPDATVWLLETCMQAARTGAPARELRVVSGGVVVDVDHTAQHDLHTGIQQVVRNAIPRWDRDHDLVLVAWIPGCGAQRALSRAERQRVLRWRDAPAGDGADRAESTAELPLVVPWRSTVVLAEVPPAAACERLAAMGQYSGNRLAAIGYDCVPIVSADMMPIVEPNRFARYLTVIKHSRCVAGISVSAAAEFRGFADALPTQGLAGPTVVECPLPREGMAAAPAGPPPEPDPVPTVLSVGSFEPRKNHLALLYVAERLWREGMAFRLRLIGGSGWGQELPRQVRHLQAKGYPLTTETGVDDEQLAAAYRGARFTAFASLHEGFGLPVAESLAFGTPVITSDYGSTREIGELGGTVLVDPRDDEALVVAMRTLLEDDERLAALRAEIKAAPVRSWEQYAEQTWACLVTRDAVDSGAEAR